MSDTPDWLGPAQDCLLDKGLDEAADMLGAAPAKADILERTIAILESYIQKRHQHRYQWQLQAALVQMSEVIAEHRGETPEATLARLSPPPTP